MKKLYLFILITITFGQMAMQAQGLQITQLQSLNGAPGSSFTIYGSGFDASTADNTVTFIPAGGGSGATATVTAASSTKLTVTVPIVLGGNYTISVERASDSSSDKAIALFAVTSGGGVFGSVGSSENIVSDNAYGPVSVHAGDVDGDGDMDLMAASLTGQEIIWYENDGSQNYTKNVVSNTSANFQSVYAADVDGDGDLDMMAASINTDQIVWYENDGASDPSFTEQVVTTAVDRPNSVYAGDVDGDGDMDLMSASQDDDKIAWHENDGSQNFTERVLSSSADNAYDVYAADVDDDGDLDLMSASFDDDKIAWYENNGATDPTFTERVVTTDADGARSVYARDVDGDGDLDLMSASSVAEGKIAWYENDGSQNFTERVVSSTVARATSMHAGDMDGDGDLDLMLASYSDDKIVWYENDGSQNFTEREISNTADNVQEVYAADVDSDGDLDLVSASRNDDKIAWYENASPLKVSQVQPLNGTPGTAITIHGSAFEEETADNTVTFTPAVGGSGITATVTEASATQLTVTIPEVSGDHYSISVERTSDGAIKTVSELFAVTADGGIFGNLGSSEIIVSEAADGARSVYAGDIDGDGDLDLMSASNSGDKISWYENDGNQTFTEEVITTSVDGPRSVHAADVDGDGDLDLVSALTTDLKIAWYENDGASDPSFTEHVVSSDAGFPQSVYVGDVDGDGDLDLMSATSFDDEIAWYENDGDQNFTERVITTNADLAFSVYAGDVDGDGDLDLMSASSGDDKIAWYENDGAIDPSFTEQVVTSNADGAFRVHARDIDGDGDLDLMSASEEDDKIAWYENDGAADPSFTERVVTTSADGASSVYAGDVNGDGNLDLMSASKNDNKIVWYENDGSQNFTEQAITTGADGAISVYAGDIDGNGTLDLISASENDSKIAWYENIPVSMSGRSLEFDGTDDFININVIAGELGNDPDFTFEGWVKPGASVESGMIFAANSSDGSSNQLFILSGNADGGANKEIRVSDGSVNEDEIVTEALALNEWYHVAYTLSSGTGTLYLNGKEVGSHTLDASLTSSDQYSIGQEYDGVSESNFFVGNIDELRIWSTVLSPEDIRQNMFQKLSGDEQDLLAYWPLDENSELEAKDMTSNELDVSLSGAVDRSAETHPYGTFITGNEGWRMMSSPLKNVSYNQILDTLWTQGFPGSDSPDNGTPNVLYYDEANRQFTSISDADDIPSTGTGFITYVYDDQDYDGSADGFPKQIQSDSSQAVGSVSPSLSFTDTGTLADDGWNLMGNPYGSTIIWGATSKPASANLDDSFYVWNESASGGAGDYQSWNGASGTFGTSRIAPWQGFWVKANAADPSITFTDENRGAGGVFRKQAPVPELQFTVSDGRFSNSAILMLDEQALSNKDPRDAYKLSSLNTDYLSLFTQTSEGEALDINALPVELEESISIPMDIDRGGTLSTQTEFELSWNYQALPEGWRFKLVDNTTGEEIDILESSKLSIELKPSEVSKTVKRQNLASPRHQVLSPQVMKAKTGHPRFTLAITSNQAVTNERLAEIPQQVELQQNYPNPFNPTTTIEYGVPEAGQVSLEVFDMLGRKVATLINRETQQAGRYSIQFDARHMASGLYLYRLKAGNTVITKKLTLIK